MSDGPARDVRFAANGRLRFADAEDPAATTPVTPSSAGTNDDFERDAQGIRYGTLGVPLALRREPTDTDFADPRFEVIWELIKRVDVDYRNGTFSGATGNDVCAVLDALDGVVPEDAAIHPSDQRVASDADPSTSPQRDQGIV